MLLALDIIVIILIWRYYEQIEATAFDEEFAQVRGIPTRVVFLVILAVTAIAVVLLQTFVGIVMVIAMLTLPAGTAGFGAKSLAAMMVASTIYSFIFSTVGLAAGWVFDAPVGAMVVVTAGLFYLGRLLANALKKRRRRA